MPAKNILNEDIWEKAKKAAGKGNEKNYDMISHIYTKMGGKYSQKTVGKATMKLQDLLKGAGKMDEINKLKSLLKAKYKRRWKGKSGKWEYEYYEPKGKEKKGKKEITLDWDVEARHRSARGGRELTHQEKKEAVQLEKKYKELAKKYHPQAEKLVNDNIPKDLLKKYEQDPFYVMANIPELSKYKNILEEAARLWNKPAEMTRIKTTKAENNKMKKAQTIEPWQLNLMKVDHRA